MATKKYYDLKRIESEKCDYNIIIGERSNGKSYALLKKILTDYVKNQREGAYIRRWQDDILARRGDTLFAPLVADGTLDKLTHGDYDNIIYTKRAWHLAKFDREKRKMRADVNPFCYAFALSEMEHDKSTSYPKVTTIVFDEFLTRKYYLPDEFILYMNVLSTIIRDRNDVRIYMLGNTVNKYCPYFEEMGLGNVETQEQGTIDVYSFGNSLKIAVEYCDSVSKSKKSNKYFSFDNPRLNMITNGKWELAIYPHLPQGFKIEKKDILFTFYIVFAQKKIACDVVSKDNGLFCFARPKTTCIKEGSLIYTNDYMPFANVRRSFLNPMDNIDNRIKILFSTDRIFYQSNEIGEIVRNYLIASAKR